MKLKLVDSGWGQLLSNALRADHSKVRVICPFIKERAAWRILEYGNPPQILVITRFDLNCFLQGASDIAALRLLYEAGAQIRGVRNLHAKAYLIGSRAIVTSANLTEQALSRNHEFGFLSDDPEIVLTCDAYFDKLWRRAGSNVTASKLDEWNQTVTDSLASGAGTRIPPKLKDEGVDAGLAKQGESQPNWVTTAGQGFVKFFGEGHNRKEHSFRVLEEVKRAGCHWACSYPKAKRPRSVQDGAILFMGRLATHPNDTLIFGRAIGMKYQHVRDDATEADINFPERGWKAKWPRYIRVHDAEFVDGVLGDGVPLSELMGEFGAHAFASTKRHLDAGSGNTNPRTAFAQQAHVELTPEAIAWLNARLDQCFATHGKIPPAVLAKLDWPKIPGIAG